MKLRDQTINAIKDMPLDDLLKVHELVFFLKNRGVPTPAQGKDIHSFAKIRKILSKCKGSLADDIRKDREDRF